MSVNPHSRRDRWGISAIGTIGTFLVWYASTAVFGIFNELVLPSPIQVWGAFYTTQELIYSNFWSTVTASAVGFILAVTGGVLVAVVLTSNDRLRNTFMPLILSGNSVPRIALAPLIIFYVGGFDAKYMISAWVAFFPMLVNAMEGLDDVDSELENLTAALGATYWQELKWVRFHAALPFIFDGLRIAATLSILGAVVGEFVSSSEGMGYLALFALKSFDTALVFAVVTIMGLFAATAFLSIFVLQDRVVHWRETNLLQ